MSLLLFGGMEQTSMLFVSLMSHAIKNRLLLLVLDVLESDQSPVSNMVLGNESL